MAQLIYSILALLMIMFLSMNMQRGIGQNNQEQTLNEVTTQLTGAGTQVLEKIGSGYFDVYNKTFADDPSTVRLCGLLNESQTDRLATSGAFATCGDFDTCDYIEGYNGMTETVTRDGFEYDVSIRVRYSNETAPSDTLTQTFAKEVLLTIENPYLYLGDDPTQTLDVTMSRVFTYACATETKYIPFTPSGGCPVYACVKQ